uniref:Putative secreted protein n=1 Tax=Ixodes ricinus TaxID=34613 RepID=A0A147BQM5_IXORI
MCKHIIVCRAVCFLIFHASKGRRVSVISRTNPPVAKMTRYLKSAQNIEQACTVPLDLGKNRAPSWARCPQGRLMHPYTIPAGRESWAKLVLESVSVHGVSRAEFSISRPLHSRAAWRVPSPRARGHGRPIRSTADDHCPRPGPVQTPCAPGSCTPGGPWFGRCRPGPPSSHRHKTPAKRA